jgi:transposase
VIAFVAMVQEESRVREADIARIEDRVSSANVARSRLMEHVDHVIQELWRRTEGADSRITAEVQRLTDRVAELEAELSELRAGSPGATGSHGTGA